MKKENPIRCKARSLFKLIIFILLLDSCSSGNDKKVKLELVDESAWFQPAVKFQDSLVYISGIGEVRIGKTPSALIAFKAHDTISGYIFQDIDADGLPDKETRVKFDENQEAVLQVCSPEFWKERGSLAFIYILRYNKGTNYINYRPKYFRLGKFENNDRVFEIKLMDLDGDLRFDTNDARKGTNIGIREEGEELFEWQYSKDPIKIGDAFFSITIMKPDGSSVLLEELDLSPPGINERFTALDLDTSSTYINKIELSKDRYTLFEFWYTRCGACIANIPNLIKWSEENSDKVNIIGICVDKAENRERAKEIIEKYHISWQHEYIQDTDPFWTISGAMPQKNKYSMPLYILVDDSGIIKYIQPGFAGYNAIGEIINK